MDQKVLSATNLRKEYGSVVAVNDVSFDVGRNEVLGLLGPNGAGKTTIINMILGVLEPTSGASSMGEVDARMHRREALHRCRRLRPSLRSSKSHVFNADLSVRRLADFGVGPPLSFLLVSAP